MVRQQETAVQAEGSKYNVQNTFRIWNKSKVRGSCNHTWEKTTAKLQSNAYTVAGMRYALDILFY